MKRIEFKANVQKLVNESFEVLNEKMDTLLASGAIDLETADVRTCKAAVRAFLLHEADQYIPIGERSETHSYHREVSNMRYMM
jgi:hypothetical protein